MKAESNPKILLVEDEPETADVLKQLLEIKLSAEVEVAGTIVDARELLQSGIYDLVTLDFVMPEGNTLGLLSEITSTEDHPPVIVVTGRGDEEIASMAFQRGASGYIVKNDRLAASLTQAAEKALRDFVLMRAIEAIRESEAFYRTLFDESAAALYIETQEGEIKAANRAACEMLGYTADELRGKSALELVPADKRDQFEDAVADVLEGRSVEFENIRKDGRRIPVEVTAKEVITRGGTRYVVTTRDVSERKQTQKALENERAFSEDALNAISDIFVVADLHGSFYKWNRSLLNITGYSDEEVKSMRTFEFFSPEDYTRMMGAIETIVQTGEPQSREVTLITKEGRETSFEITGSLIRDSDGHPLGIAGIGRDISERKKSEDALRNVIKETNERREEITALLEGTRLVLERREFEEAAREVFNICLQLLGAVAGYIAVFEEESGRSEMLLVEPDTLRETFDPGSHMPVDKLKTPAFMSGRAFYENNVGLSEWGQAVPEEHLRIDNILVAPLLVEGVPVGMMGFVNKPGGFTGRDALMASAFGEVASLALRDSRTLQMLQDSEERFRSVAETALEAIIFADNDANIVYWNPSAQEVFGYSPEEMVGKPLTNILPERFREARLQSLLEESMSEAAVPSRIFEMTGLRKDGTEFPMELSRSAWRSADHAGDTNFAVIIRDVTERKEADESIRESEELYRTLLYTSPDVVIVTDLEGIVLDISRSNLEIFGFSDPQEIIGRNGFEFIAPQDWELGRATMRKVLDECAVTNLELNLIKNDGNPIIGEVSVAVLSDKDGKPRGFVGAVRDVTERKQAEHDLRVLNKELEGYAHVVSHDLKGPLSSMMAAGLALRGLLKGEWNEDAVRGTFELIDIIESNVKKSSTLIDDLLQLANAGQKPLDATDVEIAEVVAGVVSERAEDIKKRRIKVELDEDLGRVRANRTHMYQLFSNLIANAIKHNTNRKPEISISYLGRDDSGLHRYLARDNGPGIDPANIENIFLPFFSTKEGDTGIGLATVEKIVNVYGGSIRAYNDDGACFEFSLKDHD